MTVEFTTRPTLRGVFGMVSSTHWIASASAMAVLEAGGNAFDAAVAAGFVLQVVEPHLNGPGGEVQAVLSIAGDRRPRVLAGQGPAPARATAEHFRSLGLDLVPGTGMLAATVPGAFDAWLMLLRDRGTMGPAPHLAVRDRLRGRRAPDRRWRRFHGAHGRGAVPRRLDQFGRALAPASVGCR